MSDTQNIKMKKGSCVITVKSANSEFWKKQGYKEVSAAPEKIPVKG